MRHTSCFAILAVAIALIVALTSAKADILFESGTLGPTGVSWDDLTSQIVPGSNVNSAIFKGVRFQLTQRALISQVGGHFASPSTGAFFGAIVALDNENDFPNSPNLSTPDVLGAASLNVFNPSAESFGNLNLTLNPGWYALVFGSGLFGTSGFGAAVRNGADIGNPTYITSQSGSAWFNITPISHDHRFVVLGVLLPEPESLLLTLSGMLILLRRRRRPANVCV